MGADLSELGRFSDPALLILASLASGPRHGSAMWEDTPGFSGTRLGRGPLSGALARLEQRGWIEALPAEERRSPYRLTGAGATALREQLATMHQIVTVGMRRLSAQGAG